MPYQPEPARITLALLLSGAVLAALSGIPGAYLAAILPALLYRAYWPRQP